MQFHRRLTDGTDSAAASASSLPAAELEVKTGDNFDRPLELSFHCYQPPGGDADVLLWSSGVAVINIVP